MLDLGYVREQLEVIEKMARDRGVTLEATLTMVQAADCFQVLKTPSGGLLIVSLSPSPEPNQAQKPKRAGKPAIPGALKGS